MKINLANCLSGPALHLAVVWFVLATSIAGAQGLFYVRAGATGANNGSDWNNAYSNLPGSLTRGRTYYIAGGSYAAHTFADAESGTNQIVIKKATVADHGTSTGWQDSYASAQAVLGTPPPLPERILHH